jgi:hypothetical protein
MASMLQGSGTGEYKMEEHKAVEDRGVAAVQDRKKLCSNLVSMQPRWMRNCALDGGFVALGVVLVVLGLIAFLASR